MRGVERAMILIVAAGILLRLGLLGWYLHGHGGRPETWEYESVAANLLAGRGFLLEGYGGLEGRSLIVPVFPAICALLHFLGGPGFSLYYAFQAVLAAGIIVMTYKLAAGLFGGRAGLLAAALAATDPGMIVYQSYKVDVNALSTFLILAGTLLFLKKSPVPPRTAPAAGAGILAGLGILTRPDLLCLLALPIGFWKGGKPAVRAGGAFLAGALLVVAPWLVRNHRIHGRVFLGNSAYALWRGNNPQFTGTSLSRDGLPMLETAPPGLLERVRGAGEMEREDILRGEALAYIRAEPAAFAGRALRNAAALWWFGPAMGRHQYGWVPGPLLTGYRLYHALLLAAAAAGAARLWRKGAPDSGGPLTALFCVAGALTLIHSVTFVEGRHRLLMLPFLLALSAHGVNSIWYNRPGHG